MKMKLLNVLLLSHVITIFLTVLVIAWSPLVTKGVFRIGFFVGAAVVAAFLFSPAGQWDSRTQPIPFPFSLIPYKLIAMTPYILVAETGVAGYRGFSSWLRYLSLVIAIVGGLGLIASLVIPRLLRP